MGTIIKDDPSGNIQTAINELVKQSIDLLAPCLIAGHEADSEASLRAVAGGIGLTGLRRDGNNYVRPFIEIPLKLCARCGVVYEEKVK